MDGYGSHVHVNEALNIFREHRIHIVKEEGGTSHVCQSYDQAQAKQDKSAAQQLLEVARGRIHGDIDQWTLLSILIVSIRNMDKKHWENSFKTVNLHPDCRVSFDCWIDKIGQHLQTGELSYFRTNENSHYDAMPVCWKRLSLDDREEVVSILDELYMRARESGELMWSKEKVMALQKFVGLKDMMKL